MGNMKWFILIGVAIVGLGLYAYLNPPTNVTVTGTVTTTGIGTKPTFVDFTPNHGGSASSVADHPQGDQLGAFFGFRQYYLFYL